MERVAFLMLGRGGRHQNTVRLNAAMRLWPSGCFADFRSGTWDRGGADKQADTEFH